MNDLPGWLKPVTIWLVVTLAVFLGVQAWERHQQATRFTVDGGVVELRRAPDGHYHWPGRVNGRTIEFLVDTGATGTAIPAALADELRLQTVGTMTSRTAGGIVNGRVVAADLQLDGGLKIERMPLTALPSLGAPLLGMDVLGRLKLQQEGGVLRVDLRGAGR